MTPLFVETSDIQHTQDVIFDDEDEIVQVSSGAYHTLVYTQKQKLFGIGKLNTGQLAMKMVPKGPKHTHKPVQIEITCGRNMEIKDIHTGSMNSVATVGKIVTTKKSQSKYKDSKKKS